MAITKIWSIKSRLDTSLNYIANPEKTALKPDIDAREGVIKYIKNADKTEQCKYVLTFGCSEESPFYDMTETQNRFGKKRRKNEVVAYHIVQSFKDFETTPDIAHKCGRELVERLFANKYECILATHLDHDHLHNHIIINATSYVDGTKYRNNFKDYFIDIRGTSDAICRENCLSVIEKPQKRGMHYAEWKAQNEGRPTVRGQVREEIDEIIRSSYTMKEFWKIFEERGNRLHRQGENITHISFIPACGKKPIRFTNLGEGYTVEDIQNRIIAQRNGIRTASPTELPNCRVYKFNGSHKDLKPKKLKGFIALYFHYLYFFKLIRKKRTPQRVSFFMREEITKLERYQKQFKFMYRNNIETVTELTAYHNRLEEKVNDLVNERMLLYEEKTDENFEKVKEKASKINAELTALRKEMRMCKVIYEDAHRISQIYQQAQALQKQAEQELMKDEYKRRGR
ncbi:MAG: relaxase/mobilization nuclease domain-containing protein [Clostridia bacterium]|nr:relaxase/mobilization nuclease domain-containing protein [Clostridia bacterium]